MKEGFPNFYGSSSSSGKAFGAQLDENIDIEHETIFIPYYTENKNSELDKITAQLNAQLSQHGKKMGIRSKTKLNTYITDKLDAFLTKKPDPANNYQSVMSDISKNQSVTQPGEIAQRYHHVVVVTIACSGRLDSTDGAWKELKEVLEERFKELVEDASEMSICFNIHNKGERVRSNKFDRVDEAIWQVPKKKFEHLSQRNSTKEIMAYMKNQNEENTKGLNILDKEQQAAKVRKTTEKFIQVLKLLIRIGGMLISFYIFFYNRYQKDAPSLIELKENRYCSAGDADFFPHFILDYKFIDPSDYWIWGSPRDNFEKIFWYYQGMEGQDSQTRKDANRTDVNNMLEIADKASSVENETKRMIIKSTGSAIQMQPEDDISGMRNLAKEQPYYVNVSN